jgi:fatty-acyl-CoA synthase
MGEDAAAVAVIGSPELDSHAKPSGVTLEEVRAHMEGHFAKWQMPDDVVFVEDLPLTATGKVSKLTLRDRFADYVLPELREGET